MSALNLSDRVSGLGEWRGATIWGTTVAGRNPFRSDPKLWNDSIPLQMPTNLMVSDIVQSTSCLIVGF